MNPLQISIKKYLTYQLISQSLFNKFYKVINTILSKYGINDCCNIEGCDIENLDNEIEYQMFKNLLPSIYFNKVKYYLATKFKCNDMNCCGE